jgi:hypothetical protein
MTDVRSLGIGRSMDLFRYVLYSGDENFVKDMVSKVVLEVSEEQTCVELASLLQHKNNHLLYKCLFFLMIDYHAKFRYWALSENANGLQPLCPHKSSRFLKELRDNIVPKFLVNETFQMDDFDRDLKIEYNRS